MQSNSFQGETGCWEIFPASSVLSPVEHQWDVLTHPLKNCFFPRGRVILTNAKPIWLFELCYLGASPLVDICKSSPQEKLAFEGSLPIIRAVTTVGVYGMSVSHIFLPISMWVFFQSTDAEESLN